MSDRTQDLKNLRAVATRCKNYVDETKEQILWQVGQYDITTQDDNTTAYQKIVPTGATRVKIKSIGGMSYKSENLIVLSDVAETTTNGITYKVENGIITLNGTASADTNINLNLETNNYPISSICLFNSQSNSNVSFWNRKQDGTNGSVGFTLNVTNKSYTFNDTTNVYGFRVYIKSGEVLTNFVIKPMLVSGSTAPTEYKQGFAGIRDSIVTSVKSYDSNNNLIDTYTIDSNIQALDGYGRGINSNCYNVLNLDTKAFTDKDNRYQFTGNEIWNTFNSGRYASVDLGGKSYDAYTEIPNMLPDFDTTVNARDAVLTQGGRRLSMNNNNVIVGDGITNEELVGKSFYYELATYNITNNLELPDNVIEVEEGGYLVFENQYQQAVPSNITYRIEVAK